MIELTPLERELGAIAAALRERGKLFAVVGGLAVSVRASVRFTRDVDIAVAVSDDAETERLILDLQARGYRPIAAVEHETAHRLATVRLVSSQGIKVDLLTASSGIEREIVERATSVELEGLAPLPVATAEDLLSLKILSMTAHRLQDRIDARQILLTNPDLDMQRVHDNLALMISRGFHREQDLLAKLQQLRE